MKKISCIILKSNCSTRLDEIISFGSKLTFSTFVFLHIFLYVYPELKRSLHEPYLSIGQSNKG